MQVSACMSMSCAMHGMDLAVVYVHAAPGRRWGRGVLTCAPFHASRLARVDGKARIPGIYATFVLHAWSMTHAVNFNEKCESFFGIPICTEPSKRALRISMN